MPLLKSDFKFKRLTEITPEFCKKNKIKALALDVDNTMSTHHGQEPLKGLDAWIGRMKHGGIKLVIMSNAFDKRVRPFAEKIGLSYTGTSMKPLPFSYIFTARKLGVKRRNMAIVGDQYFTDILGGKFSGVRTIMVELIAADKFKHRRAFERRFVNKQAKRKERGK